MATAPAPIGQFDTPAHAAQVSGERMPTPSADTAVRNGGLRVAVERRDADRVTVTLAGDCDGGSGEQFAAQLAPCEQKRRRRSPSTCARRDSSTPRGSPS